SASMGPVASACSLGPAPDSNSRPINFAIWAMAVRGIVLGSFPSVGASLDSSSGNQRQEDSKNREAWVRRPADRRSVEWLGRRGGRGVRACGRVGDGGGGGDGSGCWRAGRRAVCGRTKRAARPEPLWG